MALERGHVIALRRHAAGIVWMVGRTYVTIVPIGGYNGPPPHRAEVRFDDPAEIFLCGVSLRFPVVRCHQACQILLASLRSPIPLGMAPETLIRRISMALRREGEARALETRLHFNDRPTGFHPVAL